jgi:ribosome maturation factor RimP|tara:strand:- start:1387 stop:1899 length:513 start_codon:yes stop_codon:yes gene_type:complete
LRIGDALVLDKKRVELGIEEGLLDIGFEPVVIEWTGSLNRPIIRLRIDSLELDPSNSGVTIDDCARASRYLENRLEEKEMMPETYVLEVSSPGVERPLVRPKDWKRFVGESVMVQTYARNEGERSRFEGQLLGFKSELNNSQSAQILLKDGTELDVQLSDVKKATLLYEW